MAARPRPERAAKVQQLSFWATTTEAATSCNPTTRPLHSQNRPDFSRDKFDPDSVQPATVAGHRRSILSGMRLARVLGALGRGLISAGVIVLLFVAYQLWGTGLQAAAAQGDLGNEFAAATGIETDTSDVVSLVEEARASQARIESGQIFANDTEAVLAVASDATNDDGRSADSGPRSDGEATADLFEGTFDTAERQEILARLYPDAGEAFARIFIPDINVDQITVEGVSVEDLRKGPGHYQTTPNPGQAGNAAIAGHRTTYGAPFHRIDELQPGDPIFVTTAQGTFEYRVLGFEDPRDPAGPDLGYFIVAPSGTQVLDQKEGQNILTLTACHPKYSARQRIIVQAELVGEPAPTIPRADAAELGAVTLANEDIDERAAAAQAADGDAEVPEEEQVIIGDDVAADDDPSVDADGNPIEPGDDDVAAGPGSADDDSADSQPGAADEATTEVADAAEGVDGDVVADDEADVADQAEEGAELASSQTPQTTDDFGEGLNGDSTKVKPAVMWGISGLFIWITAWFMGNRLDRKWTLYAVGLVPFAIVLWSTFVNVDQALPSY